MRAARFAFALTLFFAGCTLDAESDDVKMPTNQPPPRELPLELLEAPAEVEVAPIPQDPHLAERRADRLAHYEKDLLDTYERCGQHSAGWDDSARAALIAGADFLGRPARVGDRQLKACALARQAIADGCTDPSVNYMFARLAYGECASRRETENAFDIAVAGMRSPTCTYPALRRAFVFVRAAAWLAGDGMSLPNSRDRARVLLQEATALLPATLADCRADPMKAGLEYELGTSILQTYSRLGHRNKSALQLLERELPQDSSAKVLRLMLVGFSANFDAWESRGAIGAGNFAFDSWSFAWDSLDTAAQALTEAWACDPRQAAPAARLMLDVQTGMDDGRAVFDLWFRRAMEADGDDQGSCLDKLTYLEPQWFGSAAEMLSFGRACLRTGNWEARLPFVLVNAHTRLARVNEVSYWQRPYVWRDLCSVYEPYLRLNPASNFDRSNFARFACLSGHYDVAKQQFELVGDNYWRTVFGDAKEYETMRQAAQEGKPLPVVQLPHRGRGH